MLATTYSFFPPLPQCDSSFNRVRDEKLGFPILPVHSLSLRQYFPRGAGQQHFSFPHPELHRLNSRWTQWRAKGLLPPRSTHYRTEAHPTCGRPRILAPPTLSYLSTFIEWKFCGRKGSLKRPESTIPAQHLAIKFESSWGTVPSVGNVAQPPLGKASGERGWRAGPTSMDRFSHGKSGLHCT